MNKCEIQKNKIENLENCKNGKIFNVLDMGNSVVGGDTNNGKEDVLN